MLLSLAINNCLIFDSTVEFSMRANMHYKRFGCNVASMNGVNVLKSAIVIGPNNSGKTNFVRIVSDLKKFIFGKNDVWERNLFSSNPIVEIGVSFLENEKEYVFEFKYDTSKKEYIYERLSVVEGEGRKYAKEVDLILRDTIKLQYYIEGTDNSDALRYASKGNILVYTGNADVFPFLSEAKKILHGFASRIDVLNMNSISISKTIDMMKSSDDTNRKIAGFVKNADLFLEDYRYLNDAEASVMYREHDIHHINGVEQIDTGSQDVLIEQMHLASVYKGITLPSIFFDSSGTKKIAALASYIIDALEHGKILVIDELDNGLHFRLTRSIISMFNNDLNRCAQLIATVHDPSLLDCQTLFRKEQIWFTHKDLENTYLYSLAEFKSDKDKVRETSDLINKYWKGYFGAMPEPDLFSTLLEVTGNGKDSDN